jgi:hypothetical protein
MIFTCWFIVFVGSKLIFAILNAVFIPLFMVLALWFAFLKFKDALKIR